MKQVIVTIIACGDNENTPEEAVHHGLEYARKAGFIEAWNDDAADRIEALEADLAQWVRQAEDNSGGWQRACLRIEALEKALREDINILLNLLNPLHGELDKQSYDEKLSQNFDAPPDAEYNVNITAQMERDLTQAVLILESRRAALAPEQEK